MRDDERGSYSSDVLAGDWRSAGRPRPTTVEAVVGLVVEEGATGWCGEVVEVDKQSVGLEDRFGRVRRFPLGPGYLIDGEATHLVRPKAGIAADARITASGSIADPAGTRARVARASRIYVEGRHDAELVERVWGDDLRSEGVVVERLDGVDRLASALAERPPGPSSRIGVLVDHLVAGSKESRIAAEIAAGEHGRHVLVLGHPYVDVWQAVKPARLGLAEWPSIPRNVEWKRGICAHLGWPHESTADVASAWRRILATVRSYADLEPAFLGRVEQLIDFVTAGADG